MATNILKMGGSEMKLGRTCNLFMIRFLVLFMVVSSGFLAQAADEKPVFKPEELDQLLAPIALYPDSLLTQILMASTYPLEVVQADRWTQQNKDLKGDDLAKALEEQPWDPSVKSLVNFPQILKMMDEKLDWTQKLGDAFLAQQKEVMDAVQKLRSKAEEAGNLKTSKEQKVIVEKETKTIIIEPADPQVIYVPAYDPLVVFGPWWFPAYPPFFFYPPGFILAPRAVFVFGPVFYIGPAWGYAWGYPVWRAGHVNINIHQNIVVNRYINRDRAVQNLRAQGRIGQDGKGTWSHEVSHRAGVPYRDQKTAQKFNRGTSPPASKARENFRGRQEPGPGKGTEHSGRAESHDLRSREPSGRGGAFHGIEHGGAERGFSNRGRASGGSMQHGVRDRR